MQICRGSTCSSLSWHPIKYQSNYLSIQHTDPFSFWTRAAKSKNELESDQAHRLKSNNVYRTLNKKSSNFSVSLISLASFHVGGRLLSTTIQRYKGSVSAVYHMPHAAFAAALYVRSSRLCTMTQYVMWNSVSCQFVFAAIWPRQIPAYLLHLATKFDEAVLFDHKLIYMTWKTEIV